MYFRPRSGMSSQRGAAQRAPNTDWPVCQSHSEIVPTGQIQLQKALRSRNEIARKAIEHEHAGGMQLGHRAGQHEGLQVHQRRDRQPGLDAVGPRDLHRRAAGFVVAHPEVELHADHERDRAERDLDGQPHLLGPVAAPPRERLLMKR